MVVRPLHDEPAANGKGHWVYVDALFGVESVPSTMLEVMPSQPTGDLDAYGRSTAAPKATPP